jgi:hypothetical protein
VPATETPTPQTVDAFLGDQGGVLTPDDKILLRALLIDVFQAKATPESKEKEVVNFTPDNSALQPRMAASAD